MKVSINVTWEKKNREKLMSTGVRVMAVRVTGRFDSETQIVRLWHEGSMTWVQCQLGFVGNPVATKRHLLRSFAINSFLINQEHMTCLSWATTCLVYGLGGQN